MCLGKYGVWDLHFDVPRLKVFSLKDTALDICQAYLSVRLDEYTKRLTAFYFDKKIYCWNKLSQGLQNAPMLFIYFLTLVFSDESLSDALKELTTSEMELLQRSHTKIGWSEFLESYFDDIWIFSEDHELHYVHLKLTFHALYKAKLKINPKKVKMYTYECSILGQKFNSKNIELFMASFILYLICYNFTFHMFVFPF